LQQAGDVKEDIMPLPPLQGSHGDTGTVFWINSLMMYNQSKNPEAAGIFVRWWSKNNLRLWTEGHAGNVPARRPFVENVAAGEARYQYIVDHYSPIAKTTAALYKGIFPKLNEVEGEGVMQTFAQQIFQGVPAAQALNQAETRLKEIMGE